MAVALVASEASSHQKVDEHVVAVYGLVAVAYAPVVAVYVQVEVVDDHVEVVAHPVDKAALDRNNHNNRHIHTQYMHAENALMAPLYKQLMSSPVQIVLKHF